MNRVQRSRHLQMWRIMAILLPVGIVLSWLVIPDIVPVKTVIQDKVKLLPVIKTTLTKPGYIIKLRKNENNTQSQLEWINTAPLKVPSAVIYQITNNIFSTDSARIVGRIETRGNYVFELTGDAQPGTRFHFVLYDFIHQKVIDSLNF